MRICTKIVCLCLEKILFSTRLELWHVSQYLVSDARRTWKWGRNKLSQRQRLPVQPRSWLSGYRACGCAVSGRCSGWSEGILGMTKLCISPAPLLPHCVRNTQHTCSLKRCRLQYFQIWLNACHDTYTPWGHRQNAKEKDKRHSWRKSGSMYT